MTRDGKIVLIHQERIPIRTAIWEMPSGQIDSPTQETVEQVALRELREEAGYEFAKDGELIALGQYFTSPGFTDERGYFFLARPVQKCKEASAGDEGESILDCREFSVAEIRRSARKRNFQAISGAFGRVAMDDCEDGNHARVGDDCLLHISLDARADIAGSVARRGITNRNTQSTRYHRFNRDLLSSGVLRRYRSLLSAAALFHRGVCAAGAHRRRKALFASGYFS